MANYSNSKSLSVSLSENSISQLSDCYLSTLNNSLPTYKENENADIPRIMNFSDIFKNHNEVKQPFEAFMNISGDASNEEKIMLQKTQLEALRNRVKVQTLEINRLKTRNRTLERASKYNKMCEAASVSRLKSQLESLQQCFDVLIWKMEGQILESGKLTSKGVKISAKESKQDLMKFQNEINELFGHVRNKLGKWEQNQMDMQAEMQWTKILLLKLNGLITDKFSLSQPIREHVHRSLKRKLVDNNRCKDSSSVRDISPMSKEVSPVEELHPKNAPIQNKKPNIYDVEAEIRAFCASETKQTSSLEKFRHSLESSGESIKTIIVKKEFTGMPLDLSACQPHDNCNDVAHA